MAKLTGKQAKLLEEIVTSLSSFGVTPNPVVGQENPSRRYCKDTYKKKEKNI